MSDESVVGAGCDVSASRKADSGVTASSSAKAKCSETDGDVVDCCCCHAHCLGADGDVVDGVDFYENESGTLFMESSVDTAIRCVMAERHDAITIPAGTYEFGSQVEYDPFTAHLQKVRD